MNLCDSSSENVVIQRKDNNSIDNEIQTLEEGQEENSRADKDEVSGCTSCEV